MERKREIRRMFEGKHVGRRARMFTIYGRCFTAWNFLGKEWKWERKNGQNALRRNVIENGKMDGMLVGFYGRGKAGRNEKSGGKTMEEGRQECKIFLRKKNVGKKKIYAMIAGKYGRGGRGEMYGMMKGKMDGMPIWRNKYREDVGNCR